MTYLNQDKNPNQLLNMLRFLKMTRYGRTILMKKGLLDSLVH